MPVFTWPPKDPNERLDYEHDWSERIEAGDVILPYAGAQPALALVDEGDVVVDSSTLDGNVQRVWLSGGTDKAGEYDKLTIRVQTQAGRILDEGVRLQIREK